MLFELLKSQNFSGRDYDDFEVEIMDYGFATIRKWIRVKRPGFSSASFTALC